MPDWVRDDDEASDERDDEGVRLRCEDCLLAEGGAK
jgi:hypothetical protein